MTYHDFSGDPWIPSGGSGDIFTVPSLGGSQFPPVHLELPSQIGPLPPLVDPGSGGLGGGSFGISAPPGYYEQFDPRPPEWTGSTGPLNVIAAGSNVSGGQILTPTVTATINPPGPLDVTFSGVFPTEETVPQINLGAFGQLGAAAGGLFGDIFQTDQSWDQWGAGLGTIADILAVTGVIPGGGAGHYPGAPLPTRTLPVPPPPPAGQIPTILPWDPYELFPAPPRYEIPTQPHVYPGGGPSMPHIPTSVPSAMPGGAPLLQQAFVGLPGIDIVGEGAQVIVPRMTPGGIRWPSRKDVPTRTGYTTYKNMGPPIAFAGDFAAVKRVKKLATRARRALGGRR